MFSVCLPLTFDCIVCWLYSSSHLSFPVPAQTRTIQHLNLSLSLSPLSLSLSSPQREAADGEIKVPSGENTERKRSPFKVWSRSVYSLTCCAYCQRFPRCSFLSFRSIHLHFFQNLSRFLLCWLWLIHGPCVRPAE